MKIVWRDSARADVRAAIAYIAEHDEDAAERVSASIKTCAARLLDYPLMYPEGRAPGTREALAHPNYILVYRVASETVEIVRLVHTRQRYP